MTLRPYQQRAIDTLDARVRAGAKRVLLVLCTGGGKTLIAANIMASAVARGERVLFLAHRRELIQQTYRKLVDAGVPESMVGVIMANDGSGNSAAIRSGNSAAPRRKERGE